MSGSNSPLDPASRAGGQLVLGRDEWVALPDLGLPAIRAKVDTGARTSALHAFALQTFGPAEAPWVLFRVQPIPGRADVDVDQFSPDTIDCP